MNLSNKNIIITGASKGLGRETAIRLCRQNPNLVLVARTESLLKQTQMEIEKLTGKKPLIIPCDVSSETDVNRMANVIREKYEHVDVLINNAGIGIHKTSEKMSNEEMRKQFKINFFGAFYCIKALLPLLKLGDSAYILNVNSLVSKIAFADNSVYAATKSALAGFSQGLRQEMKVSNIRVGLFFPGLMKTSFQNDRKDGNKFPPFMVVDPRKAAIKMEKMIINRSKKAYIRRLMIIMLMKVKQLIR